MLIPQKLQSGDEIRIIAPARSLSIIGEENIRLATEKLEKSWYKVTFGKHVFERDMFDSSSIASRVQDLHEAFLDINVRVILTVIGGYNSNQLLESIDYNLIAKNPKILCWFSDITILAHAITEKTGLITYSGPHFSTFAMQQWLEYTYEYFQKCLTRNTPFEIIHSDCWSDDLWFLNQKERDFITDTQYWILRPGTAQGKIIWGHMRCLATLQGTQYMPRLQNSILFLEEDEEIWAAEFDRLLQSLIHQADFSWVCGVVIGRFQKKSYITQTYLQRIISTKKALKNIPIVANADFWHTSPMITFPIWGIARIEIGENVSIKILQH